nr:MAG: capsid protein [Istigobius nigroocellatus astrovirus]
MSQPMSRRERRGRAAAKRKGETYDPTKVAKKVPSVQTVNQKAAGVVHQRKRRRYTSFPTSRNQVSSGITTRDTKGVYNLIVGQINGTPDDYGNQLVVPCNPRTLAERAKAPRLRVDASMHQKYELKYIDVEATPLADRSVVGGTQLMITEGGSANSPTAPENVNTAKERRGVIITIGERGCYRYVPPKRVYLTRPDGDASETTPGFIFCSTYLPTNVLFNGTPFTGPLWTISVKAHYVFTVFEDPVKSVEDAVVSQRIKGTVTITQDNDGTPVIDSPDIKELSRLIKPSREAKLKPITKDGVLMLTGLAATAAAAIPGPLGLLIKAGVLVAKLVIALMPKRKGNDDVLEERPVLRVYSSVDDALENRPVNAPGLVPTEVPVDGSVTTIIAGINPITTTNEQSHNDIAVPQVQKATSPDSWMMFGIEVKDQNTPYWTSTSGLPTALIFDNFGQVTLNGTGYSYQVDPENVRVVFSNPDGNVWYEGPLANAPRNATIGERVVAYVDELKIATTEYKRVVYYRYSTKTLYWQHIGTASNNYPSLSGRSYTSKDMWNSSRSSIEKRHLHWIYTEYQRNYRAVEKSDAEAAGLEPSETTTYDPLQLNRERAEALMEELSVITDDYSEKLELSDFPDVEDQ